jgi:alpha-glucan, water dikinase
MQILPLIQSAVACRLELAPALPGNTDLLYLDLSLEDVVRGAIERGVGSLGMGAAAFVGPLLQNLVRFCLFLPALQSQVCDVCTTCVAA